MKKTKIIATMWPVSETTEQIKALFDAWVNIIRFNFSHADYENTLKIVNRIKELNIAGKTKLSIMLDTKWPEIRTWKLSDKIQYEKWDIFKIFVDEKLLEWEKSLYCDYKYLIEDINVWEIIRIDSGLFDVLVLEKTFDYLLVEAMNPALIWSNRHVNLPWMKLRLPWITQKDKDDLLFAVQNDFNFIAASFIRTKENVLEIRDFLKENNAEHIKIISKIENQEWLDNVEEIVKYSDWIMVARWDLWIEVPIAMLPIYQKNIVRKTKEYWKFVIVATHFLESMIENPYPTRAEISDIFNAVWQKVDATMLSWETTVWKYPLKSVEFMKSVIDQAEQTIQYQHEDFSNEWLTQRDIEKKLLIHSAINIWEKLDAKAILIFTKSWLLARFASSFRPNIPVYAFTNKRSSGWYMNILFGIVPKYLEFIEYPWNTLERSIDILLKKWSLNMDDKIIAVTDISKWWNEIPAIEIIYVKDYMNL